MSSWLTWLIPDYRLFSFQQHSRRLTQQRNLRKCKVICLSSFLFFFFNISFNPQVAHVTQALGRLCDAPQESKCLPLLQECVRRQDGRRAPYSSITIPARSLGSCLLCRHVGTRMFARALSISKQTGCDFSAPHRFLSGRVLSYSSLSALSSKVLGIHAQFSFLLHLPDSKARSHSGFARTRHVTPYTPACRASKYDMKHEILENFLLEMIYLQCL